TRVALLTSEPARQKFDAASENLQDQAPKRSARQKDSALGRTRRNCGSSNFLQKSNAAGVCTSVAAGPSSGYGVRPGAGWRMANTCSPTILAWPPTTTLPVGVARPREKDSCH